MKTTIGRTYRFEAAHHLPLLPHGHKCRNVHGHNYRVEITLSGDLDARGFVIDFAELDEVVGPLIKRLDHRMLNDVVGLQNPTAENIAAWFMANIERYAIQRVRVYETDDCWAEVSA